MNFIYNRCFQLLIALGLGWNHSLKLIGAMSMWLMYSAYTNRYTLKKAYNSIKQLATIKLISKFNSTVKHPTKRHTYIISYYIGDHKYKMIVTKKRGPTNIIEVNEVTTAGEKIKDVTETFKEFYGPDNHIEITPEDMGLNDIEVVLRCGATHKHPKGEKIYFP